MRAFCIFIAFVLLSLLPLPPSSFLSLPLLLSRGPLVGRFGGRLKPPRCEARSAGGLVLFIPPKGPGVADRRFGSSLLRPPRLTVLRSDRTILEGPARGRPE